MGQTLETVIYDGTSWVGNRTFFPDPPNPPADIFDYGVTEPTILNTGIAGGGKVDGDLLVMNGNLTTVNPHDGSTIVPGSIVENLLVKGWVKPVVGGVTFRNVVCTGENIVPTGTSYYPLFDNRNNYTQGVNTFEFCEARPFSPSYRWNGFQGGNVNLFRCKGLGCADFLSPHGSSSAPDKEFKAWGCFAEQFYAGPDPNQSDGVVHADYCQAQSRLSLLELIGNAAGWNNRPRTSNNLLQTNQGGTYVKFINRRNWWRGNPTQGSTTNIPVGSAVFTVFQYSENRVSDTGNIPFGNARVNINSTVRTTFASTIFGNISEETGLPIPIGNA
jgi:hypothetical protein